MHTSRHQKVGQLTISDKGIGFKINAEDKRHGLGLVRRSWNGFARL